MLMTKCIVLICGPPACLKSTLIQTLRLIFNEQENLNLQSFCIKKLRDILSRRKNIDIDYKFLLFDQLFDGYEEDIIQNELNWKLYRSLIANEIEKRILMNDDRENLFNLKYSSQILNRLDQILGEFHRQNIVFIEDIFYYSSMRYRYRQIAQRGQIGFVAVHLYSNLSVALQRNQQREQSRRVSPSSIENIYSKYEFADNDLIIDTTDYGLTAEHLKRILQRIDQACLEPERQINVIDHEQQRQRETEINQLNFIYQTDQKLRKFISKYLKEQFEKNEKFRTNNEKKSYAECINDRRQQFLELLRRNLFVLNDNDNVEEIFEQFLQKSN